MALRRNASVLGDSDSHNRGAAVILRHAAAGTYCRVSACTIGYSVIAIPTGLITHAHEQRVSKTSLAAKMSRSASKARMNIARNIVTDAAVSCRIKQQACRRRNQTPSGGLNHLFAPGNMAQLVVLFPAQQNAGKNVVNFAVFGIRRANHHHSAKKSGFRSENRRALCRSSAGSNNSAPPRSSIAN